MALVLKDRVQVTSTTTGTGTFTLGSAVSGFQDFSVIGNGNTTYYAIVGETEWEVGLGTYTSSGTTLSRDTILESSNGGTAVNFSAGTKNVFVTYPAEQGIYKDASGNSIALGTPASATLTNATGLPISTGVSGLGTGVATFLGTPSSSNLASAVTDETGSGSLVFATSPTLVTPALGTPSSGTLTSCTGLPLTTGVTGTLPVTNGGTGLTSLTTGLIPYGAGTSPYASSSTLQYSVQYSTGTNPVLYSTSGLAAGTGTVSYPTTNTGVGFYSRGATSNGGILIQDGNGRLNQYWNAYTDSGGYKYTVSGEAAARYLMSVNSTTGASHAWYGAPSGTAGAALTWTTMANWVSGTGGFAWISPRGTSSDFYIDINGNVGIGTTSPTVKLDVIGSIEASPAATQDGVILAGRAGGTSSFAVTLTPTTLTASRTITLPDSTTTMVGTDTTQTLTNKTISADNNTLSGIAASSFVLSNASGNIDGAAAQKAIPSGTVVGTTDTQTLTNKRVTPRVSTTTSSATPTINTDNVDVFGLTAQTVDITSFTTNLSGTPTDGQRLLIYIVGTAARAITWGASFESSTVTLPTTTVSTNRLDVGFIWNAATSKWRCVATA